MKKRNFFKKLVSTVLISTMAVTMLTACGNSDTAGTEASVSEETGQAEDLYTVRIMMVGDSKTEDAEAVSEEISKISREKIGANVEIVRVGFGSYQQQANLALSSGEKLDLLVTFALDMGTLASTGQILPMTDLLEEHGQDILNELSEADRKCVSINGEIYTIPTTKEKATNYGFVMRKDIADEIGATPETVTNLEELEEVMIKAKEKYPDMYPIGLDFTNVYRPTTMDPMGAGVGVVRSLSNDTTVINEIDTEEYQEFVNKMYQWSQAGLVMPDATNNSESRLGLMKANKVMGGFIGLNPGNAEDLARQLGQELAVFTLTKPFSTTSHVASMGWSLAAGTENAEKAIAFLNLAHSDADVQNLLVNGIEGKHYVVVDEEKGIIDYPEGVDYTTTGWTTLPWACPNASQTYLWKGENEDKWVELDEYNKNATPSPAKGFSFDPANVENEITACNNVSAKYALGLESGTLNPEETLPKYKEELEEAGAGRIIEEKQRQLDAWLEENK